LRSRVPAFDFDHELYTLKDTVPLLKDRHSLFRIPIYKPRTAASRSSPIRGCGDDFRRFGIVQAVDIA
jgi:hypothetical protein